MPFFYWRIGEGADATLDAWGEPRMIRDRQDLARAASDVAAALRPQFLAWLEGQHIPEDVVIDASSTETVRLAGAEVR